MKLSLLFISVAFGGFTFYSPIDSCKYYDWKNTFCFNLNNVDGTETFEKFNLPKTEFSSPLVSFEFTNDNDNYWWWIHHPNKGPIIRYREGTIQVFSKVKLLWSKSISNCVIHSVSWSNSGGGLFINKQCTFDTHGYRVQKFDRNGKQKWERHLAKHVELKDLSVPLAVRIYAHRKGGNVYSTYFVDGKETSVRLLQKDGSVLNSLSVECDAQRFCITGFTTDERSNVFFVVKSSKESMQLNFYDKTLTNLHWRSSPVDDTAIGEGGGGFGENGARSIIGHNAIYIMAGFQENDSGGCEVFAINKKNGELLERSPDFYSGGYCSGEPLVKYDSKKNVDLLWIERDGRDIEPQIFPIEYK